MTERLKNTLLAALLALMLLLTGATMFLSMRTSRSGGRIDAAETDGENGRLRLSAAQTAAYPEQLAVFCEGGVWQPLQKADYELLYQQAEPFYLEALGSAGTLLPMEEEEYLRRMRPPAVLVQYHAPQPLALLRIWSGGTGTDGDVMIRRTVITLDHENVIALFTDETGGRWQAGTVASAEELRKICGAAGEVNAVLAGTEQTPLAADEVLIDRVFSAEEVLVTLAEFAQKGELPQNVLTALGMNAYLSKVYPDAEGNLVYVEGRSTVRVSGAGDLHYTGEADLDLSATRGPEMEAEVCRKIAYLLEQIWSLTGSGGTLSLEELRREADGALALRFGLQEGGRFFERSEGLWAAAVVRDGILTDLMASPRVLETGESLLLMPLSKVSAALPEGRARLCVRLLEREPGVFEPAVCRVTED